MLYNLIKNIDNCLIHYIIYQKRLKEKLRKNAENLLSSYGTIEDIQIRYEVYANSVRADAEITMAERIEEKKQNIETENQNEEKEQENANEL